MTTLTFQNKTLSVINQHNQIWLTTSDIGKALGYRNPLADIPKLYSRHQDEFTPNMTALVDMQTAGGIQKVRIFSLRGCHLIGMLSHTKVAKDFRHWVLDILDKEVLQNQQQNLPLARQERMMTVRLPESDLKDIAWLWFAADKMQKFIDSLQPALQILGSNLYGTAYSYQKEYGDLIQFIGPMIYKLTKDVDFSDRPTPIKALEQAIAQPKPKRLAKL